MPSTPEDRRRKGYRAILQAGREVQYEPKTETNRRILAEVRAEFQQAKRQIQREADQGSKKLKLATDESVQRIEAATNQALCKINAASSAPHPAAEQKQDDGEEQQTASALHPVTSATEHDEEQEQ